ncbi:hypothetical protein [Roseovarius sp. D0-M9]|uniref:hypothetical protein n=1 Tax=Roseovarius sp. D0-M9 TaxID=3127117 RepID=UPI0030104D57
MAASTGRTAALSWVDQRRFGAVNNLWGGLQTVLGSGCVEIGSNIVENMIHSVAFNRKERRFRLNEGGKAWGRIASLFEK